MNNETPINVDGSPDLMGKAGQLLHAMRERAGKAVCLLDARMRTLTVEPEEGAATAEYAVVLVAATGFAAVLVGIMIANGQTVTASSYNLLMLGTTNSISFLSAHFLAPCMNIFLGFSVVSAISPTLRLSTLCNTISKIVKWSFIFFKICR